MVWTFVLDFLKSKVLSILLIAALAIGGWYHFYKVNDLEEDVAIGQTTIAILANEYEQSVITAKHNADMVLVKDKEHKDTLIILRDKHDSDMKRLQDINDILERTRHVDEKDDGNVSNVMRSTLDAIRVLREDSEL